MNNENKIKVLVLKNNEFYVKEIDDTLQALQKEVNGHIEIPYISRRLVNNGIDVIINDEGKLLDLEPQIIVQDNNKILDVIHGTCVFASHDEDGNTISLTDEQIEYVKEELAIELIDFSRCAMLKILNFC